MSKFFGGFAESATYGVYRKMVARCCGLIADELGGVHPEGIGQLADRASLRLRHLARFEVEDRRGGHAGVLRWLPVRGKL